MIPSNTFLPILVLSVLIGSVFFIQPKLIKNAAAIKGVMAIFSIVLSITLVIAVYNDKKYKELKEKIDQTEDDFIEANAKIEKVEEQLEETFKTARLQEAIDTVDTEHIATRLDSAQSATSKDELTLTKVKSERSGETVDSVSDRPPTVTSIDDRAYKIVDNTSYSQISYIDKLIDTTRQKIDKMRELEEKLQAQVNASNKDFFKGGRTDKYEGELRKIRGEIRSLDRKSRKLIVKREKLAMAAASSYSLDTTKANRDK